MKREELLKKAYENTKSVVPPRNEVENENVIAEIEGGEDRRIQEAQLGLFNRLNDDKRIDVIQYKRMREEFEE